MNILVLMWDKFKASNSFIGLYIALLYSSDTEECQAVKKISSEVAGDDDSFTEAKSSTIRKRKAVTKARERNNRRLQDVVSDDSDR